MHWTRTSVRLILILPMSTSRLVCSSSRTVKVQQVPLTRAMLLYLRTSTLKRISQPLFMALPLLSGVLNLLSRLRDLLHLLLEALAGIALWLRLEIRACRLSLSILMSSARVFAHLHNMLPSAQ